VGVSWPAILSRLLAGEHLDRATAAGAMHSIMAGEATPAQVAAFAIALRAKGETAEEVGALADVMLELAPSVPIPKPVIDTCGTGGDRAGTINVSTLAAIVAAGAGAFVAKHGNRAVSSRCGSADLLEALGVKVALPPAGVSRCLAECGIGFLFAPMFHSAMANAAAPRREVGVPTVFNFLGPLTNPARPAAQVVGVGDARMLPVLAEVLAARRGRAYVVRGTDGLDEMTTTGPTEVHDVKGGAVTKFHLLPIEVGVPVARAEQLLGGGVEGNVAAAKSVLGGEQGAARDIVSLNAAAALMLADLASDLSEGLALAAESIDSGKAGRVLSSWIEVSNRA
jgi:anthranilate phosphoribosyltransferase